MLDVYIAQSYLRLSPRSRSTRRCYRRTVKSQICVLTLVSLCRVSTITCSCTYDWYWGHQSLKVDRQVDQGQTRGIRSRNTDRFCRQIFHRCHEKHPSQRDRAGRTLTYHDALCFLPKFLWGARIEIFRGSTCGCHLVPCLRAAASSSHAANWGRFGSRAIRSKS